MPLSSPFEYTESILLVHTSFGPSCSQRINFGNTEAWAGVLLIRLEDAGNAANKVSQRLRLGISFYDADNPPSTGKIPPVT